MSGRCQRTSAGIFKDGVPFHPIFHTKLGCRLTSCDFLHTDFNRNCHGPSVARGCLHGSVKNMNMCPGCGMRPRGKFGTRLKFGRKCGTNGLRKFTSITTFCARCGSVIRFRFNLFGGTSLDVVGDIASTVRVLGGNGNFNVKTRFRGISGTRVCKVRVDAGNVCAFGGGTGLLCGLKCMCARPESTSCGGHGTLRGACASPLRVGRGDGSNGCLGCHPGRDFGTALSFR